MFETKKIKLCSRFRAIDQEMNASYQRVMILNCKNCAYFSSRNCGMDTITSLEPSIDIFY